MSASCSSLVRALRASSASIIARPGRGRLIAGSLLAASLFPALPLSAAQAQVATTAPALPTYARMVRLADRAPLVIRARIVKQIAVPAEQAPGVAAGQARQYLVAETLANLAGTGAAPVSFAYLADLPLDAKGRAPKLKKREVLLFAAPVAGRPGELQLVAPDAQLDATPELEASLRPILASLVAADAPPRVTGIRDVLSTEGNLVGESETQIFLATADDRPAALTVVRTPGMAPRWGVSWSELVDQSATPPAARTLAWYRLACGLPATLPARAQLGSDPRDNARAAADYRFVIGELGSCDSGAAANPR